jgi:2'-5' RNA ligase
VSSPASVATDARLRLFLALRLPEDVLDGIEAWQAVHLRGVRAVARHNLHVTLAFLGHRPASELDAILGELRQAAAAAPADLRLAATGYRETRSVYRREGRPWLPHVTVARFRERPRLRLEPPALGTYVPSDAAAFLSRLRPAGAEYEVVAAVALGGR